ncbi:MAG: shikimate dehydrogenase [Candidatus Peribacteraceae bacterium]|nr:shikimate dehydrogenase [Candidatus Peribacteraceae bacterium]
MKEFGILAYPAGHSLSPAMHSAAFRELGIEATYDFFEIPPEELESFFQNEVRTGKIDGLSVSIPHKVEVIKFLDEVTDAAKKIGAINTVYWQDEKLMGDNTDWLGFLNSFEDPIETKKVVVLGGGGAARAIVFALLEQNCEVTVITREAWEYEGIQKDFAVATDLITNLDQHNPNILINATPLGMQGKFAGQSFVDPKFFDNHKPLVFDIVYNPRETKLLSDAKKSGCKTIEGLQMLVNQAVYQFEKFTGKPVTFETMWEAAVAELNG